MPNWKCPADLFSFCNGTPEWEKEPVTYTMQDGKLGSPVGGKCKLDRESCGRLLKYSEIVKEDPKLGKSNLIMKVIPIAGNEKKEEKVKAKGKNAKKLEQEMQQGSML